MQIRLPYSGNHPYVAVLLVTPKGECKGSADCSHSVLDIPLPEGVDEDEVDVFSCFLDAGQNVPNGVGPVLLQAAKRKPLLESVVAPLVIAVETAAQSALSAVEAVATAEAPVADAPVADAPAAEPAPAAEAPAAEPAPVADAPAADSAPAADVPAADAPVAEAPAAKPAPVADAPVAEVPVADAPAAEPAPVAEAPAA
jgi:hypothetical protein